MASHVVPDGPLGSGWDLRATSVIQRRSDDGGVPNFTTASRYVVDGEPLVMVPGPGGSHYQASHYDGARYEYDGTTNVWTKQLNGWTWTYGTTTGTGLAATKRIYSLYGRSNQLMTPTGPAIVLSFTTPTGVLCPNGNVHCNTAAWYLSRAVDPHGNEIVYSYEVALVPSALGGTYWYADSRDHLLSTITYGGAEVRFHYGDRPDTRMDVSAGTPSLRVKRVEEIEVLAQSQTYARYLFQYTDQTTSTRITGTLTDCDGNTVTAPASPPRQSVLRKILRGGDIQRTLRCLNTASESEAWESVGEAVNITTEIARGPGPGAYQIPDDFSVPIAVNIDEDGATDLVVLGFSGSNGSYSTDHRVYVATPKAAGSTFASATTGPPLARAAALEWQDQIQSVLTSAFANAGRGYAFTDIDGNSHVDLIYEKASGSVVFLAKGGLGNFFEITTNLDECDLRHATFADVDGDRLPDAIVRAHGSKNGCAALDDSVWIRNLGSSPWLRSSDALSLRMPLESAAPPSAWTEALDACPGDAVSWPGVYNPDWSHENHYIASNTTFTDVNGDGLVDAVQALYGCWELQPDDSFLPVDASEYSAVFWGDGYGEFVDSRLWGGSPHLLATGQFSGGISEKRLLPGFSASVDVNRSGSTELFYGVRGRNGWGTGIEGRYYRGLELGFGTGSGVSVNGDFVPSNMDYVGHGWACLETAVAPAFGDFDGDGFLDILTIEVQHQPQAGSPCTAGDWCVLLRKNKRAASEHRLKTSRNAWGGTTQLTWGFSALHKNPNLPVNVEVLEEVDGASGRVVLSYEGGAVLADGAPTNFATVEVENARGATTKYKFATTKPIAGKPLYAVRHRKDDSIERATVYVYGRRNGSAHELSLTPPYFNPLLRQCDFDVGQGSATGAQTVTIDALVNNCWSDGSPINFHLVEVMVGVSHNPFDQETWTFYDEVWYKRAPSTPFVDLTGVSAAATTWSVGPLVHGMPWAGPFTRWPPPSNLAGKLPSVSTAEAGYSQPVMGNPTDYRMFIEEWFYDHPTRKLLRSENRRWTAIAEDNRKTEYVWEMPDPAGFWYRMTEMTERDAAGQQVSMVRRSSFTGFDEPTIIDECGTTAAHCRQRQLNYGPGGDVISVVHPDGSSESWVRNWCGEPEQHVDTAGRVRTNVYDGKCRLTTTTFEGASTVRTYDDLNRVSSIQHQPNGSPSTLIERWIDDDLDAHEDEDYTEPRFAERRNDGRVTLTYLDGFGRETMRKVCADSGTPSGTGVLAHVDCANGTDRVVQQQLYGNDGLVKYAVRAYAPGEEPDVTGFAHDGTGRVVVRYDPANTETKHQWNQRRRKYLIGGMVEQDVALGRDREVWFDTLNLGEQVDGVSRGSRTFDEYGRVLVVEGPDGGQIEVSYDEYNDVSEIARTDTVTCLTSPTTSAICTWRVQFPDHDPMGRVTRRIGPDGVERTTTYDLAGRVTSRSIAGETIETRSYTSYVVGSPASVTVTDESGATTVVERDGFGRILAETTVAGGWANIWGANGELTQRTDPNGLVTTYEYDGTGRLSALVSPQHGRLTITRDGADRVTSLEDADSVIEYYTYAYSGRPIRVERGPWTMSELEYDSVGRVVARTTEGVRREMTYDVFDRPTTVRDGVDVAASTWLAETTLTYDSGDRVLTRSEWPINNDFKTTTYDYNAYGWHTSTTDALGGLTSIDHDVAGRPLLVRDPESYERIFEYDPRGRALKSPTFGKGSVHATYTAGVTYSPVGGGSIPDLLRVDLQDDEDLVQVPAAATSSYYDGLGRPIARVERDGSVREFDWDQARYAGSRHYDAGGGLVAEQDVEYDGGGRPFRRIGPYAAADALDDRHLAEVTYTAAGRLESLTVPSAGVAGSGDDTSFVYTHGLLSSETYLGLTRSLNRDTPGLSRVTSIDIEPVGGGATRTRTFAYDAMGRTTSIVTTDGGAVTQDDERLALDFFGRPGVERSKLGGVTEVEHTWQYDDVGRPLSRATQVGLNAAQTTAWAWFANGVLERTTTPSGVAIAYDYGSPFDHQLDRIYDPVGGSDYARVVSRNGRGGVTEVEVPPTNEERTTTYDLMGRPEVLETSVIGGATELTRTRIYDGNGRLAQEMFDDLVLGTNWTNAYTYDGFGRLATETHGRTGALNTYAVDRAGKRTRTSVDLAGAVTTTDFTYVGGVLDAVGAASLSYDDFQAVVSDQFGTSYARLPSGHAQTITGSGGVAVTLRRDAAGIVYGADEASGVRLTHWGLNPAGPPLEIEGPLGDTTTYISAGAGIIGKLLNGVFVTAEDDLADTLVKQSTEVLDHETAFGEGTTVPVGTDERFLFAGLERMPAGIPEVQGARLRMYDPQSGRFLRPDPIGLSGGPNRYTYANGDPVQYVDPLGLSACSTTQGQSGGLPEPVETTVLQFETSGAGENFWTEVDKLMADSAMRQMTFMPLFDTTDSPFSPGPTCFWCPPPGDEEMGPVGQVDGFGFTSAKKDREQRKAERKARKDERRRRKAERKQARLLRRYERGKYEGSFEDLYDELIDVWCKWGNPDCGTGGGGGGGEEPGGGDFPPDPPPRAGNHPGEVATIDVPPWLYEQPTEGTFTSGWNPQRMHPTKHVVRPHLAVDIAAPIGTPVTAPMDGTIDRVTPGPNQGAGNTIHLIDAYGNRHKFFHLDSFAVEVGDTVRQGDHIGDVGNTGASSGPHLHWEVWLNPGGRTDPWQVRGVGDMSRDNMQQGLGEAASRGEKREGELPSAD